MCSIDYMEHKQRALTEDNNLNIQILDEIITRIFRTRFNGSAHDLSHCGDLAAFGGSECAKTP